MIEIKTKKDIENNFDKINKSFKKMNNILFFILILTMTNVTLTFAWILIEWVMRLIEK